MNDLRSYLEADIPAMIYDTHGQSIMNLVTASLQKFPKSFVDEEQLTKFLKQKIEEWDEDGMDNDVDLRSISTVIRYCLERNKQMVAI